MPSTVNPVGLLFPGHGRASRESVTATALAFDPSTSANSALITAINDAIHRDIAIPVMEPAPEAAPITSAGDTFYTVNVTSVPAWLGDDVSTPLRDLFQIIVDGTNEEVRTVAGAPVRVVSFTAGRAVGDGFVSGSSFNATFSAAVPAGVDYRVVFSRRQDLATIDPDAISVPVVRRGAGVEEPVQDLFRALHATSGQVWNDPFDSTINDLALGGLNERYRHSTTGTGTLNTPGDGATITRDGIAPNATIPATQKADYANGFKDPWGAQWLARPAQMPGAGDSLAVSPDRIGDGGTGFVSIARRKFTNIGADDPINENGSAASFLSVIPRHTTTTTIIGKTVRSYIEPEVAGGSLNPDAGATVDARRTIELPAGQYFISPLGETEVAEGYDMILVTYTGGLASREDEVYIITELDPDGDNLVDPGPRRCLVRTFNGGEPSFPSGVATTDVTFTFVKNHYQQGGGTGYFNGQTFTHPDPINFDTMYHAVPPSITEVQGFLVGQPNRGAIFVAPAISRSETASVAYGYGSDDPIALTWGGFDPRFRTNHSTPTLAGNQVRLPGRLKGDGSVAASYLVTDRVRFESVTQTLGVGPVTITWEPSADGGTLDLVLNPSDNNKIDLTIVMDPAARIDAGTRLIVLVRWDTGHPTSGQDVDITWPKNDPINGPEVCTFDFGNGGLQLSGDAVPGKAIEDQTMWVGHTTYSRGSTKRVLFTRHIFQDIP